MVVLVDEHSKDLQMSDSIDLMSLDIESRIFTIRGFQVMLDRDLAELYGIEVKRLNEQVRRNIERFPESFRFQLNELEFKELVANCDRFKSLKHSSVRPHAFTEAGVAMLSAVLHTPVAVKISVKIIKAFVAMRKLISSNMGFVQRLENMEQKQIETDKKIDMIFDALENKEIVPECGIFYEGEVFDAYVLVNKIIKSAKQSIILIDNYIDESVLTMLSKRTPNVKVVLLTKEISKTLKLDIVKFNNQYPPIEAKILTDSHDRFLIIDNNDVYHLGASLKDLGKKWFAFSKMELSGLSLLDKIKDVV
jgi:hypothetical protein